MRSCPCGMAKCDESKHDEVAFQLAAADFGLNSLWQTSYLKLNTMLMLNMKIHIKILKKIACIGQRLMYPIMEKSNTSPH